MMMLTCKDASRLISENQDRRLGLRERWGLRVHLWLCEGCRRFERQLAFMRQALGQLGRHAEEAVGTDFPPEARERIRAALAKRCDHPH